MLSEVAEQNSLKQTTGEGRDTRAGGQAPADVVSGQPLLSDHLGLNMSSLGQPGRHTSQHSASGPSPTNWKE